MKRLIWIPLLFLCSTLWAAEPVQLARMNPYIAGSQGAAAASCTSYENRTAGDDDSSGLAVVAAGTYLGQGLYAPAANKTVCQIDVEVDGITGDLSTVDFQIEIHDMSGNNFVATAPGAGCTSTAKKLTASATNSFVGLSCAITSAGSWAIVLTRTDHGYDNSNYPLIRSIKTAISGYNGHVMRWDASNPPESDDPYGDDEFSMNVYTN